MRMERLSGILLHPSSLPGPYGIGDIGPEARAFAERLAEAGQGLWQVLPLRPTGYGDSPYAPLSSFAGNELLLSPDLLEMDGLLTREELGSRPSFPEGRVDYGALIPWKRALLDRAAAAFLAGARAERRASFDRFLLSESSWLPDYALFRAIKDDYDARAAAEGREGARWNNYWPPALALREGASLDEARERYAERIACYEVLQFLFFEQWRELKKKANGLGIGILGDLPIFVAEDSAEVWTRRELFRLDQSGRPLEVAGVPPDYFSEDGQLWGNPLYDWEAHRCELFAWWIARLGAAIGLCDALRIDHFRGFRACWAVPPGRATARGGTWDEAPGEELFTAIRAALGEELPIVAEDLGFITDDVRALRDDLGLPGMRILQFAFDETESGRAFDPANGFLPHNYPERCVVYTGTHDNNTLAGWVDQANPRELAFLRRYLGYTSRGGKAGLARALVREALKSTAAWAIIPMQDLLGLGSEARMNRPSTLGGNWAWRMGAGAFTRKLAWELADLSRLYGRCGPR